MNKNTRHDADALPAETIIAPCFGRGDLNRRVGHKWTKYGQLYLAGCGVPTPVVVLDKRTVTELCKNGCFK